VWLNATSWQIGALTVGGGNEHSEGKPEHK
jgi:hypothetical protein